MLFKAAAVVFLPPFLSGIKTPSQTRTTNVVCTREVVPFTLWNDAFRIKIFDFIPQGECCFVQEFLIPNSFRCRIPRGNAVCLNNADGQIPLSVSVGHGAEAVSCPLYQKKIKEKNVRHSNLVLCKTPRPRVLGRSGLMPPAHYNALYKSFHPGLISSISFIFLARFPAFTPWNNA